MRNKEANKISLKSEISSDKIIIWISQIINNFKNATLISLHVVSIHQETDPNRNSC